MTLLNKKHRFSSQKEIFAILSNVKKLIVEKKLISTLTVKIAIILP